MAISRHQIREKAFQTLFGLAGNPDANMDTLYQDVLEDVKSSQEEVPAYLKELVTGVLAHTTELQTTISKYLASGWTYDRLARADRIILELAFFEMHFVEKEVPTKVVIDESINLAKTFSDEQSRKFINGVLDNAIKED